MHSKYIIKIYHTQHDIAKTFFVDFAIRVNEHLSLKKSEFSGCFLIGWVLQGLKKGGHFSPYTQYESRFDCLGTIRYVTNQSILRVLFKHRPKVQ